MREHSGPLIERTSQGKFDMNSVLKNELTCDNATKPMDVDQHFWLTYAQ